MYVFCPHIYHGLDLLHCPAIQQTKIKLRVLNDLTYVPSSMVLKTGGAMQKPESPKQVRLRLFQDPGQHFKQLFHNQFSTDSGNVL